MQASHVNPCPCRASTEAVALRGSIPSLAPKAERGARSARRKQQWCRLSDCLPAPPGVPALRSRCTSAGTSASASASGTASASVRIRTSARTSASASISVSASASASVGPGGTDGPATQPQQDAATAEADAQKQAWQLLQDFTRLNARGLDQGMLDSPAKRERLRAATLVRLSGFNFMHSFAVSEETV